jgi:hypothetical protein
MQTNGGTQAVRPGIYCQSLQSAQFRERDFSFFRKAHCRALLLHKSSRQQSAQIAMGYLGFAVAHGASVRDVCEPTEVMKVHKTSFV